MAFADVMMKIRYWDNKMAKWIMRHFYILFFEILLVLVFIALFVITIKVIDISFDVPRDNVTAHLLSLQSANQILVTLLLLLNSFWMLYLFSGMIRIRSILKEISFHLSKRKN